VDRLAGPLLAGLGVAAFAVGLRRRQNLDDFDNAIALSQNLVVRPVQRLQIDLAAQRVAGADIELTAVEFVKLGAWLRHGYRARAAMLQPPLAAPLIVGHFDEEDHVGRMVDQLA
jgi:hypothetical protein